MMKCPAGGLDLPSARLSDASQPLPFEQLFHEHVGYVARTLRYLGVREANIEDACQDVFVVLHRRQKDYREVGTLRAWVRQVCVLVAHNQRRTVRRRREDVSGEPPDGVVPPAQQSDVELAQLRAQLLGVLDELPTQQRDVFVLYEIEGLTMAEVAAALSCPLQTAYSRLNSARVKVRAQVEEVIKHG